MNASTDDGGSKESGAVSLLKVSLWPLNAFSCLLPAASLPPTSFCSLSNLGLQNHSHLSPYPSDSSEKRVLDTAFMLIFASPNSLLLHLVTLWPHLFPRFQFEPYTILLFTSTSHCMSLSGRSTNTLCSDRSLMLWHNLSTPSFPTPWGITKIVHWLICILSLLKLDFTQGGWGLYVSIQPLLQWGSWVLRVGVTWHPLMPQSFLPVASGVGSADEGPPWARREAAIELMSSETKTAETSTKLSAQLGNFTERPFMEESTASSPDSWVYIKFLQVVAMWYLKSSLTSQRVNDQTVPWRYCLPSR